MSGCISFHFISNIDSDKGSRSVVKSSDWDLLCHHIQMILGASSWLVSFKFDYER